jgi:hypothetical protein
MIRQHYSTLRNSGSIRKYRLANFHATATRKVHRLLDITPSAVGYVHGHDSTLRLASVKAERTETEILWIGIIQQKQPYLCHQFTN